MCFTQLQQVSPEITTAHLPGFFLSQRYNGGERFCLCPLSAGQVKCRDSTGKRRSSQSSRKFHFSKCLLISTISGGKEPNPRVQEWTDYCRKTLSSPGWPLFSLLWNMPVTRWHNQPLYFSLKNEPAGGQSSSPAQMLFDGASLHKYQWFHINTNTGATGEQCSA